MVLLVRTVQTLTMDLLVLVVLVLDVAQQDVLVDTYPLTSAPLVLVDLIVVEDLRLLVQLNGIHNVQAVLVVGVLLVVQDTK